MNELLKSYDIESYYNTDSRFNIHKERIESLLKYIERFKSNTIKTIWLTDYQISLETKSKWNSNIPFFCDKKYSEDAVQFLIIQKDIRRSFGDFSISDFIFSFFKKEYDYVFRKAKSFDIKFENSTIVIELPINEKFEFIDKRIKKYKNEFANVNEANKWEYINIHKVFKEEDYNDGLINLMRKDFKSYIQNKDISFFYDFFKKQDNSNKEINLELSENFLFLVYSALLPKNIKSLIYLPTVIIKSNQDEITTGGFSIINYDTKPIDGRVKTELKLVSKNWLSENSIADYLKILRLNIERDNNAMILHNVKSIISNSLKSWVKLKESNFLSEYHSNELDNSLRKLNKRADSVLALRKKIRDPKLKKYTLELTKKNIENVLNEIIKSIIPNSILEQENIKKILDEKLVDNWIRYNSGENEPPLLEESFEVLISEIFDNAIKNNSEKLLENPISIEVDITEEKIQVIVVNDEEMPETQIEYINSGFNLNLIEESTRKTYIGIGFGLIRDCSLLMDVHNNVTPRDGYTYYKIELKNEEN